MFFIRVLFILVTAILLDGCTLYTLKNLEKNEEPGCSGTGILPEKEISGCVTVPGERISLVIDEVIEEGESVVFSIYEVGGGLLFRQSIIASEIIETAVPVLEREYEELEFRFETSNGQIFSNYIFAYTRLTSVVNSDGKIEVHLIKTIPSKTSELLCTMDLPQDINPKKIHLSFSKNGRVLFVSPTSFMDEDYHHSTFSSSVETLPFYVYDSITCEAIIELPDTGGFESYTELESDGAGNTVFVVATKYYVFWDLIHYSIPLLSGETVSSKITQDFPTIFYPPFLASDSEIIMVGYNSLRYSDQTENDPVFYAIPGEVASEIQCPSGGPYFPGSILPVPGNAGEFLIFCISRDMSPDYILSHVKINRDLMSLESQQDMDSPEKLNFFPVSVSSESVDSLFFPDGFFISLIEQNQWLLVDSAAQDINEFLKDVSIDISSNDNNWYGSTKFNDGYRLLFQNASLGSWQSLTNGKIHLDTTPEWEGVYLHINYAVYCGNNVLFITTDQGFFLVDSDSIENLSEEVTIQSQFFHAAVQP
ncbi:MAG: hypothetical protein JXR95_00360 [Deltaproteobacteria bacterium]|nr:hypothetical protein [Deltaproteobacteria bacterium]